MRREAIALALLLTAFLAINIFTADKTPAAWQDEVMYADPGVNWYQGHGFTSGAWYAQSYDKYWAGNVPLYQVVLAGWLEIFGFSIRSVRSLNYLLMATGIAVLWLAIRRLRLIASPSYRLVFCVLLCLSYCTAFVYRYARPESLCLLLVALVLLACSLSTRPLRLALLVVLGGLLTISGLQMAAYAAITAAFLWFWCAGRFRIEMIILGVGCAAGLLLLYLVYSSHNVWQDFIASIRYHTIATQKLEVNTVTGYTSLGHKFKSLPGLYRDCGLVLVFLLASCLAWREFRAGTFIWQSPLFFGLVFALALPPILFIVGVYPIYYFWMSYVPLVLGVCATLGQSPLPDAGKPFRKFAQGIIAFACLLGLPGRLLVAATEWDARSYGPVMTLAAPYVARDQVVYSEFGGYYAAKQHGATVILPTCVNMLTPDQRQKVSIAIAHPGAEETLTKFFGGEWKQTGAALAPKGGRSILGLRELLDSRVYNLAIYERQKSSLP